MRARPARHLGDPMCAGDVIPARHCDLAAASVHGVADFLAVRRDDDVVRDACIEHPLPDADNQWNAGEQAERLSGEARRAQSCWDDSERLHALRSRGVAPTAAKFTSEM
jgi:hypothetical protein